MQSHVAEKRPSQTIDAKTHGLLYLQLENVLEQRIISGEYAVGDRIPTELELCKEFGMSRITVRRAVQDLVEQGLLRKVQGRGTFVAIPKHVLGAGPSNERGFSSKAFSSTPTTRKVLDKHLGVADDKLARTLGIAPGDHIVYVRRLISEENFPLSIDNLFVSAELFPNLINLMDDNVSFYSLVSDFFGLEFGEESFTLDASAARSEEAALLQCPIGLPIFILRKIMRCADGTPMHYSKTILRADRVTYRFDVDRDGKIKSRRNEFAFTTTG